MVEVLRVAAGVPPLFEHSDGLQLYDGRLVPWGCSVSRNGRAFNVEDERVLDWLATGGSQELAQ